MKKENRIPKVIHYCWFGKNPIPKSLKKCIKSWEKYCPDYEIKQWNEENFDINCNEFVREAYENKAWAFVSDYARLWIIYNNGGIYLDTDVEIVKNIDELLKYDCYLAEQQYANNVATGLGFGAQKHNQTIKLMLEEYENLKFDIDKKNEIICPILNTRAIEKEYNYIYSNDIIYYEKINTIIFPPKYFDPLAPGISEDLLCDETYSIHHYSATWTSKNNRLRRRIIQLIGQKNVNNLKKIIRNKKG